MNSTETTSTAAPAPLVIGNDSPGDVSRTRDAVRLFADNLDPALDTEMAETLILVASELASNALRHGGGRYTVHLSATPETVCLAISDPSPTPPQERTPDLKGGTGGFGWHIIRRLTDSVTITPGPGQGKTIHARLTRRPRQEEHRHSTAATLAAINNGLRSPKIQDASAQSASAAQVNLHPAGHDHLPVQSFPAPDRFRRPAHPSVRGRHHVISPHGLVRPHPVGQGIKQPSRAS
ncbi:ATP-binding protein [Streptomyces sp. SID8352]|uniref:ATP-binding protein n=1 Tax=Streptomyces sp. SID8352 TaxID=2690338 RepID=UPI00136DFCEB|nr:ATP-binding protein [Streptomyces sp. SID8352]MYU23507.1 hypothetical protein [Streptomyces sp. SID8352]